MFLSTLPLPQLRNEYFLFFFQLQQHLQKSHFTSEKSRNSSWIVQGCHVLGSRVAFESSVVRQE